MKISPVFVLVFMLLVSPVFAVGNITVTGRDILPGGNYTNSNTSVALLNITFAITVEPGASVNITAINIGVGNGSTSGNISAIELYLSNDTTVVGSSGTPTNATSYNISTNTIVVTNSSNASVIVRVNVSRNVTTRQLLSVLLVSAADITRDSGSNVTVSGTILSNATQIQDLHANVSISPNFVDTNAINQTIVYTIVPTGADAINHTIITIPSGYNLTNISTIQLDGSNITANVTSIGKGYINISIPTPTTNPIKVTFNVNTSTTRVIGTFTSTIDGHNRTGIPAEHANVSAVNVTTQQLINVTSVALAKGAAIVNGSDYWEFNFTINFTATMTGLIQFKMTNWTDASSPPNNIHVNESTTYYATLRNNSANFSDANGKVNITNYYVDNWGINRTVTENSTLTFILRMIIPSGTAVSNSWASTYNWLFRTSPS